MAPSKTSVRWTSAVVASLVVGLLILSGCDPEVVGNRDSVPTQSSISGTVIVDGAVTGDVVLLLYMCDEPPPPRGSAKPMDFILVPSTEFVNGEAEFIFPNIDPGADATADGDALANCYLMSGFMDADHDWTPFYDVAGQPTAGDIMSGENEIDVYGALEVGGFPEPVTDVVIKLETPIEHDRPVFDMVMTHTSTGASKCGVELEEPGPLTYAVGKQTDYDSPYDMACATMSALPISTPVVDQSDPMFHIVFEPDLDGDGYPDDTNGDGTIGDVKYPRILFVRLDPDDPTKLTRAGDTVILPGVVFPADLTDLGNPYTNPLSAYLAKGLPFDGETGIYSPELKFALPELVVANPYVTPPETVPIPDYMDQYPTVDVLGEYQINVVMATGQIWYTPNLLMGYGVEGQDQVLTLTE